MGEKQYLDSYLQSQSKSTTSVIKKKRGGKKFLFSFTKLWSYPISSIEIIYNIFYIFHSQISGQVFWHVAKHGAVTIGDGVDIVTTGENLVCRCILVNLFQ